MHKRDVKQLAEQVGLSKIAKKKESVGICFVGKRNFKDFIADYIPPKPGHFVHMETGSVLGEHDGIHQYTLGQRVLLPGMPLKMYVHSKLDDQATILVAGGFFNPAFFSNTLYTAKPHWIDESPCEENTTVNLEFCFQHIDPLIQCKVTRVNDGLCVQLEKPLRALTPGQFACFYRGDECLGSAKIVKVGTTRQSNDRIACDESNCKETHINS